VLFQNGNRFPNPTSGSAAFRFTEGAAGDFRVVAKCLWTYIQNIYLRVTIYCAVTIVSLDSSQGERFYGLWGTV